MPKCQPSEDSPVLEKNVRPPRAGGTNGNATKLKFPGDSGFHVELKRRVSEYFQTTGRSPRDSVRMYLKSAAIFLWFGLSYALLVFAATTWWEGLILSCSLALAMAGIGFSIQHDANHGAYSKYSAVNRIMGLALDMMGASSYIWHWKHNILHHTYTNLNGADDDINLVPFARFSPAQPRYRVHRFQQFYIWALYGFLYPKWHLVDDFSNLTSARIAQNRIPRPRGWSLVEMLGGKLVFGAWAFLIPMLFHRWWVVLIFYAATSFLLGMILAIVFQLAHCVQEADFPHVPEGTRDVPSAWAVHQVQSTVNFARRNRILTWYLGGLNFQIEHHLFPKICHVHYPRISAIVQAACDEFGVRYVSHDRLFSAVSSHWRWLRRMGLPITPAA
jgi:linoleoyl-CoA desaturase